MDVIVLPDTEKTAGIHDVIRRHGYSCSIHHSSGRPWILGRWGSREAREATASNCRMALLGLVGAHDDALDRAVRSIRSFRDVDALYDRVPGSYITAVAFNGSTRVHGTLAATHEIFYADVDGIVVAANKASILARIAERAIRREMLATTLLAPRAPWPLSDRPLWKGVEHVPVTDALELHPDGRGVIVPRWSYPAHREPLTDIAPRLRAALEAGVRARADATPVLGSDLSGGLDSTTLAFYADRHAQRLVTVRQDAYDATNDDVKWAALARSRMGTGDHIRMEPDVAPGMRNGIRPRTATRARRTPP